jgi:hypothetical protein
MVGGAPEILLVLLAGIGGLFAAAIPGGYLARLPAAVPAEALPRALTATAVAIEVSWVIGPLLVTGTALVAPPVYALALVAGLLFVALVTETRLPARAWPAVVERAESPWRDARARRTYALAGIIALGFGVVDSAMPALLGTVGLEPALAGVLTGIPAGASVISGSLLLARRTDLSGQGTAAAARLGMFAGVTLLPLALMSSFAGFAVVLGVAGIWMSPMNAVWSHVLQDALPDARRAEGFTLLHASLRLGIGCGAGVSAVLLPYFGPAALVSVAGLVPLLGCGAVLMRTRLDRTPVGYAE